MGSRAGTDLKEIITPRIDTADDDAAVTVGIKHNTRSGGLRDGGRALELGAATISSPTTPEDEERSNVV